MDRFYQKPLDLLFPFRNHLLPLCILLIRVMLDAGGIKPYHGGTFFNNLLISFYVLLYNIKLLFFTMNYSAAYTICVPIPLLNLRTLLVALGPFSYSLA